MSQPSPAISIPNREETFAAVRLRILGLARKLGCGQDSADVAQETMLELSRHYAEINSVEDLVKLANRICVNKVLNLRRQHRRVSVPADGQATGSPNAEDMLAQKELREEMEKALPRCSQRCKELLRIMLSGEESADVLSRELRCSKSALYSIKSRCLQELRSILEAGR